MYLLGPFWTLPYSDHFFELNHARAVFQSVAIISSEQRIHPATLSFLSSYE